MDTESESGAKAPDWYGLGTTADLAAVREALAEIESLEDELRHRVAHLRAVLPPEQFRLVWMLLDAQERLGLVERLLTEHAAAVRATARPSSKGGSASGNVR